MPADLDHYLRAFRTLHVNRAGERASPREAVHAIISSPCQAARAWSKPWQRRFCACTVYTHASTIIRMNTWDEAKRGRNLTDHGIDFADIEGFFDGDLLTREDERDSYGERRYQSIGVFNGVALFVVWTPRGEEGDIPHIISARKAENHEEKSWARYYRK